MIHVIRFFFGMFTILFFCALSYGIFVTFDFVLRNSIETGVILFLFVLSYYIGCISEVEE